jgi:hypothetical protein
MRTVQQSGALCYTFFMSRKVACVLLAMCACAPSVPALSLTDIDANASLLMIGTFPPTGYGGGNPALTYLVGASLPLWFTNVFFLEPGLELFSTYYEWTYASATAVPTLRELAGSFFTLGTLITTQAGVSLPISKAVSLGGSLGLDFLLRFPLEFFNPYPESINGKQPAQTYFFAQGRFFYPEARFFVRWTMSASMTLVVNLRAFFPLFHAWDGLSQPFLDQFMGSAGIGMAFRLGAPPAPAASR